MGVQGAKWSGKWSGGRIREADGRRIYVIEKMAGGSRHTVKLTVGTEEEALAELALFIRDPAAYRTAEQAQAASPGGAKLDAAALEEFLTAAKGEGLTEDYIKHILGHYLTDWGVALKGRDLRGVSLPEIRALLKRWKTARRHRIVAIKSFTKWLREEGRLPREKDPTIDLPTPQPKPEKSVRAKGYSIAQIEQVYAELPSQVLRDTICLRAKSGMHDTEIGRIARGDAVLREINDPSGIFGTITFEHKKAGKIHVVSVDAHAFAAAERLQRRGTPLSRNAAKVMLDRAARRLQERCGSDEEREKIVAIHPGELRHSFATWARRMGRLVRPNEGGVPLAEVAAVMGHIDEETTQTFYVGDTVPSMIALPLRLHHSEDPVALSTAARSAVAS